MAKVSIDPVSDCWLWTGMLSRLRGGYGVFTHRPSGAFQARAHRIAYELFIGSPGEMDVLHKCDTPACVNPDHLFLGNQADNMADKVRKGRQNVGDRHGMHKLTEQDAVAILRSEGPHAAIAARFGVTIVTVSDIKRRRSWRHLTA